MLWARSKYSTMQAKSRKSQTVPWFDKWFWFMLVTYADMYGQWRHSGQFRVVFLAVFRAEVKWMNNLNWPKNRNIETEKLKSSRTSISPNSKFSQNIFKKCISNNRSCFEPLDIQKNIIRDHQNPNSWLSLISKFEISNSNQWFFDENAQDSNQYLVDRNLKKNV